MIWVSVFAIDVFHLSGIVKNTTERPFRDSANRYQLFKQANVLMLFSRLPPQLKRLDMRIRYRGPALDPRLTPDTLTVRGRNKGPPLLPCPCGARPAVSKVAPLASSG
ncbi:MAG: glycosyl hydrolase family 65 protein [Lautropia sp.]